MVLTLVVVVCGVTMFIVVHNLMGLPRLTHAPRQMARSPQPVALGPALPRMIHVEGLDRVLAELERTRPRARAERALAPEPEPAIPAAAAAAVHAPVAAPPVVSGVPQLPVVSNVPPVPKRMAKGSVPPPLPSRPPATPPPVPPHLPRPGLYRVDKPANGHFALPAPNRRR